MLFQFNFESESISRASWSSRVSARNVETSITAASRGSAEAEQEAEVKKQELMALGWTDRPEMPN